VARQELKASENLGHASKAVLTLSAELLDKGYTIYVDNFYSSPELLSLSHKDRQTDICGTIWGGGGVGEQNRSHGNETEKRGKAS
jgi:hypothetical protein